MGKDSFSIFRNDRKITRLWYLLLLQLLLRLLLPLWLVSACEGLLLLNQSDLKNMSSASQLTQQRFFFTSVLASSTLASPSPNLLLTSFSTTDIASCSFNLWFSMYSASPLSIRASLVLIWWPCLPPLKYFSIINIACYCQMQDVLKKIIYLRAVLPPQAFTSSSSVSVRRRERSWSLKIKLFQSERIWAFKRNAMTSFNKKWQSPVQVHLILDKARVGLLSLFHLSPSQSARLHEVWIQLGFHLNCDLIANNFGE